MPEMFAGRWNLHYTSTDTDRQNRLVIAGSDTQDGSYEKAIGADLELPVTSELWSADVQSLNPDTREWESRPVQRGMALRRARGITVRLESVGGPPNPAGLRRNNVIEFVYRDPHRKPVARPGSVRLHVRP
jgi:hypothetical protein